MALSPTSSHGLPPEWTVDDAGNLTTAPTSGEAAGGGNVRIVAPAAANQALAITDSTIPAGLNFGVDPRGYVQATGADFYSFADVIVLRADGTSNTAADVVQFRVASGARLRLTFDGRLLMPGLPTVDPHVVGQVWSNGGVLTVSAG